MDCGNEGGASVRRLLVLLITRHLRRVAVVLCIGGSLVTSSFSQEVKKRRPTPVFKVWISNRADDRLGNGTQKNPYNGSTPAKFDALMRSIPASTHIHLGPGTFYTRGRNNYGIRPKEGWIIDGAGKDLTTIKLANGKAVSRGVAYRVIGNNASVLRGVPGGYLRYYSVRNLTLDCNKANQPVYKNLANRAKLYAIRGGANSADIINVRALNIWNYSGRGLESEGFPVNVEHDNSASNTDLIVFEGCEVIDPEGYHSAISAFTAPRTTSGSFRTIIRNCRVVNHLIGSCFSPVGAAHTEIYGNYADNCGTGTTMDTGNFVNVRIHNNRLIKMHGKAVNMFRGAGKYLNIAIYDNYFDLDIHAYHAIGHSGRGTVRDIQIYGNTIIQRSKRSQAFVFTPGTTGTIRDNIVSETKPSDLRRTNLVVANNFTPANVPLSLGVRSRKKGR